MTLIHLPVRLVPNGTRQGVAAPPRVTAPVFSIRFLQRPVAVEAPTSSGLFPAIAVASHEHWHSIQGTLLEHDSGQTK